MKSIGAGWFVNTIGGTASKYAQLNTINEQLHLNMKVKLVSDDVFDDMDARYVKTRASKLIWVEKGRERLMIQFLLISMVSLLILRTEVVVKFLPN